jgi:hypothetical protein
METSSDEEIRSQPLV